MKVTKPKPRDLNSFFHFQPLKRNLYHYFPKGDLKVLDFPHRNQNLEWMRCQGSGYSLRIFSPSHRFELSILAMVQWSTHRFKSCFKSYASHSWSRHVSPLRPRINHNHSILAPDPKLQEVGKPLQSNEFKRWDPDDPVLRSQNWHSAVTIQENPLESSPNFQTHPDSPKFSHVFTDLTWLSKCLWHFAPQWPRCCHISRSILANPFEIAENDEWPTPTQSWPKTR